MSTKQTKGRRRIEMKPIANPESRQVTFSKRRTGLFKKANDLSVVCGADIAVLVFSPAGKPYSFGNPSVDTVLDSYLSAKDLTYRKLEEAKKAALLESVNIENLGLEDLQRFKGELEELRCRLMSPGSCSGRDMIYLMHT